MTDEGGPKRISAVVGKKTIGGSMELQTFVFLPKEKWDRADVVKWLKAHDKKAEIDETDTSYRARQADPEDFVQDSFRTILITDDPEKMADTIVDNTLLADRVLDSIQYNLSVADAEKLASFKIKPSHLAVGGRENDPHVTVFFGLIPGQDNTVKSVAAKFRPVVVKTIRVVAFPEGDKGVPIVLRVESDELNRMNKLFSKLRHGVLDHPDYKPHITLAYVKPEWAALYDESEEDESDLGGMELTLTDLVLSRADDQMIKLSDSLLADTIKGKHTPDLIARGTAQKMTNLVGQNARNIAEDLTADDIMADDAEDLIISALHRYAESKLLNIAQEAVNMAYRAGRADELDDFGDEMAAAGREVVWRRSSALEPSSCEPCVSADGSEIDGPDEDLTEIHEGSPESCLCLPYADLTGEE